MTDKQCQQLEARIRELVPRLRPYDVDIRDDIHDALWRLGIDNNEDWRVDELEENSYMVATIPVINLEAVLEASTKERSKQNGSTVFEDDAMNIIMNWDYGNSLCRQTLELQEFLAGIFLKQS